MAIQFQGIVPPLTTPFAADGSILHDALERNLSRYLETSLSGFLLLGSNGEAPHLRESERVALVERSAPLIPAERHLIVGVSEATLKGSLEFLGRIGHLRIDAVLVSVPSYYRNRMDRKALHHYFAALAESSPFPVLLYNVPQYSGIELEPELVGVLAAHQNVVGMKESSGNLIYVQRVLEAVGSHDFQVILGSADILAPAWLLGIRAAILAVSCAVPELPLQVLSRYAEGREVRDLQLRLTKISRLLTARYGVPGLKHAMDCLGLEGRACRLPLLPLDPDDQRVIEESLQPYLTAEREAASPSRFHAAGRRG